MMSDAVKGRDIPLLIKTSTIPSLSKSASFGAQLQSEFANPAIYAASWNLPVPVLIKRALRISCLGSEVAMNHPLLAMSPMLTFCLKCVVAAISTEKKSSNPSLFRSATSAPIEYQVVWGTLSLITSLKTGLPDFPIPWFR